MNGSHHRVRPTQRAPLSGWLPVIAWAGLIFALSAQPDLRFAPDAGVDFVVRKVGHMGVFGILLLLLWRALEGTVDRRRPWPAAFALTVVYAVGDELHQGLVVDRHAAAMDVGIDAVGALLALLAARWIRSWRERRLRGEPDVTPPA